MAFSVPDYVFGRFDEVTPSFLQSIGVHTVLCDIDNTLVTYDDSCPTDAVLTWLESLKLAGITLIFLSNNNEQRVKLFAKDLSLDAYPKAHKPCTGKARQALKRIGASPKETAVLGDQIFTDVWTGRFLGVRAAIVVPPIKDKTSFFFRFKRWLEKPFQAAYRRREKKRQQKSQRSEIGS